MSLSFANAQTSYINSRVSIQYSLISFFPTRCFLSMSQDLVAFAIDQAQSKSSEYAEARYQKTSELSCLLRNGVPEPATMIDAEGIGIRILFDGALAFGATNVATKERISALIDRLVSNAKSASRILKENIHFSTEEAHVSKWSAEEEKKVEDVSVESMISLLKEVDSTLSGTIEDVTFPNRILVAGYEVDEKVYANTDGSKIESRVPRVYYQDILVAMHNGEPKTVSIPPGYATLGGSGGWEIIDGLNLIERIPNGAKQIATAVKATEKPPTEETLDIILGPSVSGLTSHESCGHPGEADRILGREGAQAGESFLKPDKLGMEIGSSEAFVSDDPTIPHSMGFYLYDDEGVKAGKRRLITNGKFTEFLQNRATALSFGIKSNASSRAVQFNREPIIRMANTFIEPGDWSFEEMLREVRRGVYIKSFMEWNIDDKRLNQRYVGLESFMIENGELKNPIKEPVLEITTPKYWGSIDARAKDLEYVCATCGKGDPMQGAPVFIGGPHIRLRNARVGSR
jgi:TldD protein